MKELDIKEFKGNPFSMIGKEWFLITAGNDEKANTMTASWGGMGHLWNKDVVFIFVRPQRYTKKFVEENEYFSMSFFDESYKKALSYLGVKSGKDEDKIKNQNMHIAYNDHVPYIQEGKMHLICKKLYQQDLSQEHFLDQELGLKHYPSKDFHTMYVAEVVKIIVSD